MEEIQRPVSPTQASRRLAAEGYQAAIAAAKAANDLNWRTRRNTESRDLFHSTAPRVPLSHESYRAELSKAAPPNMVPQSNYCEESDASPIGTFRGASTHGRRHLQQPVVRGFESVSSLGGPTAAGVSTLCFPSQLTSVDVASLCSLLADSTCSISRLELCGAIVESVSPSNEAIQSEVSQLSVEFPQGQEETAEKLQAAVEKLKGEYSTYEAGIQFLAMKRADPIKRLLSTIATTPSLVHLRLDGNSLGAPNADGRASYQQLRRIGKMLDDTTTLRVFDISGNAMGPVGIGILAKALTKNISIHSLDISGTDLVGEPAAEEEEDPEMEEEDPVFGELYQSLDALSELIKKNKFLRNLSMRHNRLKAEIEESGEDDGIETPLGKFLEPFKKYHRLSVLDMSCNELGAAGARMIAAALSKNHSIRTLDLSDNNLGPRGLHHIAQLLSNNNTLESLVLQKNDFSGKKGKRAQKEAQAAMMSFASALASNQSLFHLNLAGNHLGSELAGDLLSTLAMPNVLSRLTCLNLESNEIFGESDRAVRAVGAALGSPDCGIVDLNLAGNNLHPNGLQLMIEAGGSTVFHSLFSLNLSRNYLGDDGLTLLCGQLLNDRLCELHLDGNQIVNPAPLTRVLRATNSLRHVYLARNLLGDCAHSQALIDLIDAIGNRAQFESLDLSHNQLTSAHAKALAYLCHTATSPFTTLLLQNNPSVSIDEIIKMLQALLHNTSLRVFKASAPEGDHLPILTTLHQTLIKNRNLVEVDCGLSLDLAEEPLTAEVQTMLLRNALGVSSQAEILSTHTSYQAM